MKKAIMRIIAFFSNTYNIYPVFIKTDNIR